MQIFGEAMNESCVTDAEFAFTRYLFQDIPRLYISIGKNTENCESKQELPAVRKLHIFRECLKNLNKCPNFFDVTK